MKTMKKLLALLLAAVMCLGMATVAFAANDATITISDAVSGHTYKVYQIFTGDVADGVLSNVKYGTNYGETGKAVADTVLESITDAEAFAKDAAKNLLGDPVATLTSERTSVDVTPGYYLVIDTFTNGSAADADGAVISDYIVEVVGNVTISPKQTSIPTPDKKIDDGDGETVTTEYSVGDDVPFKLTATLPDSIGAYKTYKLVFVDTPTNMTVNQDSVEVYIGDTKVDSGYTTDFTNGLTVTIADVKATPFNAVANNVITVKYTAKITEAAKQENAATNDFHLEYSNNPNDPEGTGTDKIETEVKVLTFELDFDKVDGDGNALSGAGFTLYKKDAETNEYAEVAEIAPPEKNADGKYTYSFAGLGAGSYKLVESTTPAGYNTMADKEFTISATTNELGEVTALTVAGLNFESNTTDRTISGSIENNAGSNLPSTGGIGTTIFYVVGGLLIVCAGVLLITKKRMAHND